MLPAIMKRILYLLIVFSVIGCSSDYQNLDGYNKQTIELKNNVGKITFYLPNELDTTYIHQYHSDNQCDDSYLLTISNKDYKVFNLTTGFIKLSPSDSIYEVKISQPLALYDDCLIKEDLETLLKYEIVRASQENPSNPLDYQEIKTINSRDFIITGNTYQNSKLESAFFGAITLINGQLIYINYQCRANSCENFIERMYKSLMTIKITAGNKK